MADDGEGGVRSRGDREHISGEPDEPGFERPTGAPCRRPQPGDMAVANAYAPEPDQPAEPERDAETPDRDESAAPVEPAAAKPSGQAPSGVNGQHEPGPISTEPPPARPAEPAVETAKAVEPRTYDRPTTPPEQIAVVSTTPDDGKPARKGWWQRRFTGE
jgi:hypothetical protein